MTKLERLNQAQAALRAQERSYAADEDAPTQDDHDEAHGLALAVSNIIEQYKGDPDGLLEHLESMSDDDGHRGYADHAGEVLAASKKNPRIRRWIRTTAAKKVAKDAQHAAAIGAGGAAGGVVGGGVFTALAGAHVANVLEARRKRQTGLMHGHENALSANHYHEHHGDYVKRQAAKHGVSTGAVAHALAYHAHSELHRQKAATRRGGTEPYGSGGSDRNYHKDLGERAKAAFSANKRGLA